MNTLEHRARKLLRQLSYSSDSSSSFSPLSKACEHSPHKKVYQDHRADTKHQQQHNYLRENINTLNIPETDYVHTLAAKRAKSGSKHLQTQASTTSNKPTRDRSKSGHRNCLKNADTIQKKPNTKRENTNDGTSKNKFTPTQTQRLQREKVELKGRIMEMEEEIESQKRKIRKMKELVKDEQINKKSLTKQIRKQEEYEQLVEGLSEKLKQQKVVELQLMQDLNAHQQIAREAMQKLYNFQEEIVSERSNETKFVFLEKENKLLAEKNVYLSSQLVARDQLKKNFDDLKAIFEEKQRCSDLEIAELRKSLQRATKSQGYNTPGVSISNTNRDDIGYLTEIEQLRRALEERDSVILAKEEAFREQLGKINLKIVDWQHDLEKLKELENNNAVLKEKLSATKQRLGEKQQKHKIMKQQWNDIYADMVQQIEHLRGEVNYIKQSENNSAGNHTFNQSNFPSQSYY